MWREKCLPCDVGGTLNSFHCVVLRKIKHARRLAVILIIIMVIANNSSKSLSNTLVEMVEVSQSPEGFVCLSSCVFVLYEKGFLFWESL